MKEYNKLLLALSMASKVIIKPEGAETIKTVKNVPKENFNTFYVDRAKNKFLEKKKLLKSTKNVIRKNITNLTNI